MIDEFYTHTPGEDGWSEWVQPHHESYLLKCCDCGLVHELEFRVVRDGDDSAFVDLEDVVPGKVLFRARRQVTYNKGDTKTPLSPYHQLGNERWKVERAMLQHSIACEKMVLIPVTEARRRKRAFDKVVDRWLNFQRVLRDYTKFVQEGDTNANQSQPQAR